MRITRGIFNKHTNVVEIYTIEVDPDQPMHRRKMEADEVQLALHQTINRESPPPVCEIWAEKQAHDILNLESVA